MKFSGHPPIELDNNILIQHFNCNFFVPIRQEDEIITRANQNIQSIIENIHSGEIARNRKRVAEINNLIDHFREEIDSYDIGGMT